MIVVISDPYRSQLADLVLFLGFDVFPEYVSEQRALTLVLQELLRLHRAGHAASLPPALSGKRQSVSRGTERQQRQRPHRGISGTTDYYYHTVFTSSGTNQAFREDYIIVL